MPFTYAVLHRELRLLLAALFGTKVASVLSWHSIRIGLACALKMAGCPDDIIQLICRWACVDSLKIYARIGTGMHAHWTDRAAGMNFDGAQAGNIPALDRSEQLAALYDSSVEGKAQRAQLLDAGDSPTVSPVKVRKRSAADTPMATQNRTRAAAMWSTGMSVILPRELWPDEACVECGGAGWMATIQRLFPTAAPLTFDVARTAEGGEYGAVRVPLANLRVPSI